MTGNEKLEAAAPRDSRYVIRPRLLAVTLVAALIVSIGGGFVLSRLLSGDDGVDLSLDDPGEYSAPAPNDESNPGERLPDVEVLDANGKPVRTGDLVGQPLVVNLWYSSCPPCKREMPAFAQVSEEHEGRVRFVGINPVDDVDTMLDFAADVGVNYELYRDEDGSFTEAIRAVGFPMTVFVTPDGAVAKHTGELDADGLRSRIEEML